MPRLHQIVPPAFGPLAAVVTPAPRGKRTIAGGNMFGTQGKTLARVSGRLHGRHPTEARENDTAILSSLSREPRLASSRRRPREPCLGDQQRLATNIIFLSRSLGGVPGRHNRSLEAKASPGRDRREAKTLHSEEPEIKFGPLGGSVDGARHFWPTSSRPSTTAVHPFVNGGARCAAACPPHRRAQAWLARGRTNVRLYDIAAMTRFHSERTLHAPAVPSVHRWYHAVAAGW
jgi:hypothetical protein